MRSINILLITAALVTLTSCYRMPGEDEFSTIPTTNNPDVTRAKESGPTPTMNY